MTHHVCSHQLPRCLGLKRTLLIPEAVPTAPSLLSVLPASFGDDSWQKLILSEKARTKQLHGGDGGGGGIAGMMGGRRGVDGGEASDDDEAEGDMRNREGRGRPGAKEKKQKGT